MRPDWMFLWPFIKLGAGDVWRHKTRSFLTMLGMVFGVGSVIAMLAVGEGASQQALDSIRRLGSQNILVRAVKPIPDPSKPTALIVYGLYYDDARRIRETVPHVANTICARALTRHASYEDRSFEMRVVETVPDWFTVATRPLLAGRLLTADDERTCANVCVLTEFGARKLMAGRNVLGAHLRLGRVLFEVVGVVKNEEGLSARALDTDSDIYIPLSSGRNLFSLTIEVPVPTGQPQQEHVELSQIVVRMDSTAAVESAAKTIGTLIAHFHKKQDYQIDVPLSLLREAERTKRTYNIVLGAIAGISLLVGGIGIMNIMLASVTERTKEIGIRRAIGARKSRIVIQFLINTCVLSISGGLAGLLLGVTIPLVITAATGMPTVIRPYAMVLAFGISVAIGVVFGLYPALRAASLDPIEALRHE